MKARKVRVRTVFMLGSTSNHPVQREIDQEYDLFRDIVQEDMIDSYQNLTRKTIMGLKWVTNHCRQAKFAIKADDDVILNMPRIINMLSKAPLHNYTAGHAYVNAAVIRNKHDKFYTSKEFYPNSTYPPYLTGAAYIMSTDLVEATYRTAVTTTLFPWEDVFVGMCLQKMGIKIKTTGYFICVHGENNFCYSGKEEWKLFAVFYNLSEKLMLQAWQSLSPYGTFTG
ncbi:beta-1,3-galactosyltransferase 1-like [Diadema setosum]|uniref:beta-1,3-galactosyltransferase 1-like n=1 Tax=Diadema setosum TaxID=31175 RepID=UPI003B3A7AC3